MNWYKTAQEDYRDAHQSADAGSGVPLHDLSGIYPDDIYSADAVRLYSSGLPYDNESISIIKSARGNPNARIMVYRAVPNPNAEIQKELRKLYDVLDYQLRWNFFPMKSEVVDETESKLPWGEGESYDERQNSIREDLKRQATELEKSMSPRIKINPGDWVALSKQYAIDHGRSSGYSAYRILQKTVRAKDLYTTGDSIHEWGWSP